jgi:hypothetical protein
MMELAEMVREEGGLVAPKRRDSERSELSRSVTGNGQEIGGERV